jgi:hypothetical protein
LKHLSRSSADTFRVCKGCFVSWEGSVEAVVGHASYRERISHHPLVLGAETHPRRPRRWRIGMRSSTSRRGRACTSCGLGRLRFPRLLLGPCRPASTSPRPRDRVRERGGGAATGFAGRRAALPEPPFPLVGVPVTSGDPVPIAGRSGRPTWTRKRSRGVRAFRGGHRCPGPNSAPCSSRLRGASRSCARRKRRRRRPTPVLEGAAAP